MSAIDGLAAAWALLDRGTCTPGLCLNYVWKAYASVGASTGHPAVGTAYEAWQASAGKHEGDRNPPPGAAVWWGPRPGSAAGDVTISLGGGQIVATDWPWNGVIGVTTLDSRQDQIGRPYLGWTESIFDQRVIPEPAPPTPDPIPIPIPTPEGGTMFLAYDAEAARTEDARQYVLITADGGQLRARYLEDKTERAVFLAVTPALPVAGCDSHTFAAFLERLGYTYNAPIPLLEVKAGRA